MPRKMDTSRCSTAVWAHGAPLLRKSQKSVNIHTKSGFIWGIPVQEILRLIAELRPQPPPAPA